MLAGADQLDLTTRHRRGDRKGSRLDAIGKHRMPGAVQPIHALDHDARRAEARNARAHGDQAAGDVVDLRLEGGVGNHGFASGEHRGHHGVFGRADRGKGKFDMRAAQALGRPGDDIAFLKLDIGAQHLKRLDVEIDRTAANRIAARQRYFRVALARDERTEHQEARPHLGDNVVRCCRVDDISGGQRQTPALPHAGTRRPVHFGAEMAQEIEHHEDVPDRWHVIEGHRLVGQKAGRHQRHCRVLRTTDRNLTLEAAAAPDANLVHCSSMEPLGARPVFVARDCRNEQAW
ncbi:MAG TPA: hypothetical protein VJ476_06455 [Rhizomicrobium sp.]|nr:hypothetical protein [Rhizomicrobium sp.]